jgi:hypothetical protein
MKRDRELDRLTTLLGQCLGRIDEQAYRLQHDDDDEQEVDTATCSRTRRRACRNWSAR